MPSMCVFVLCYVRSILHWLNYALVQLANFSNGFTKHEPALVHVIAFILLLVCVISLALLII